MKLNAASSVADPAAIGLVKVGARLDMARNCATLQTVLSANSTRSILLASEANQFWMVILSAPEPRTRSMSLRVAVTAAGMIPTPKRTVSVFPTVASFSEIVSTPKPWSNRYRSSPASPKSVSFPAFPIRVSAPAPPFSVLSLALPVSTLFRALPVALMAASPLRARFSALAPSVYVMDALTVSDP